MGPVGAVGAQGRGRRGLAGEGVGRRKRSLPDRCRRRPCIAEAFGWDRQDGAGVVARGDRHDGSENRRLCS